MQYNRMRSARSLPYGGGVSVPDRDSLDGNPLPETPQRALDRDPLDRDPIQEGLWGSLSRASLSNGGLCPMGSLSGGSLSRASLSNGGPLDRDPHWTETPMGQRFPGQRSPRQRPPGQRPLGQRPPCTETPCVTCGACWDRDPPCEQNNRHV